MGAIKPKTMARWKAKLRQQGQGLVEYALILVTMAIVIIAILTYLGQVVFSNMYSHITSGLQGAGGG